MIRKVLLFLLCLINTLCACKRSCKSSPKHSGLITVKLSGEFKGDTPRESLSLVGTSSVEKLTLDKENKFSKTFQLKQGIYHLLDTPLYLADSFDLNITFNQDDYEKKTYTFTGKGAKENEILTNINREVWDFYGVVIGFLIQPTTIFWKKLNAFTQKLENQLSDTTLDKTFVEAEKQDIKYIAKNIAENYSINYGLTASKDGGVPKTTGKTLSQKEKDKLKQFIDQNVDLSNEKLFTVSTGYRDFLSRRYRSNIPVVGKETTSINFISLAFAAIDKTFQNEKIKEYFWHKDFSEYLMFGSADFIRDTYTAYKKRAKNPAFIQDIYERYQKATRSFKGETPPNFNYEDINGNKVSLNSLKGYYLYLDVWAQWCEPCRREQPFFERLQKQYKGKSIRFIGISVDRQKEKDKWKKHVIDHRMKSIQLITDRNFNSEFIRFFRVTIIPRFILLDKESHVISSNALRPSDPKLKKIFSSLEL
ncbi:MAG: TlpA disulfide reductase family protein [Flavobacteriales bacterium]